MKQGFCIVIPVKTGIQYNKKMDRNYYVYILASKEGGTLYIGVTNDLKRRVFEHKEGKVAGFTKEYNVKRLVYFEQTADVRSAITREKCLKKWNRKWKIELIEQRNKHWKDLHDMI
jgi:putative endonuclease